MKPSIKFAFALDGLIRSRTKGDGGEDFARKCIGEIAEALDELKLGITIVHNYTTSPDVMKPIGEVRT